MENETKETPMPLDEAEREFMIAIYSPFVALAASWRYNDDEAYLICADELEANIRAALPEGLWFNEVQ